LWRGAAQAESAEFFAVALLKAPCAVSLVFTAKFVADGGIFS